MNWQKTFNKLLKRKSGIIKQVLTYDLKSATISEPICEDLDGDDLLEIIIGTQEGDLFVLKETGELAWKFKVMEELSEVDKMFLDAEVSNSINAPPTIADINNDFRKEVLVGSELGIVYALNDKGVKLWSYKTEGAIRGKIVVADIDNDGKFEIIFGSTDKNIYILNEKGRLLEKIETGAVIESSPAIFDDLIVVGTNDGSLLAFTHEGKKKWAVKTEAKITAEPVVTNIEKNFKCILVGSTDNNMYCIDKSGNVLWKYVTQGSIYSKVLITDLNDDGLPEIIFGSCDNSLYVLNNKGIKMWSFDTDFWIVGSPITMDIDKDDQEEIVVGSYDNQVYVLSAEGMYSLGYVPGISGIVNQEGNYSEIPTQDPGEIIGQKIWNLRTSGIVIGCCKAGDRLVIQTKEGKLIWIEHKNV